MIDKFYICPVPAPRDAPGVGDAGRRVHQPPTVSGLSEEAEGRGAEPRHPPATPISLTAFF